MDAVKFGLITWHAGPMNMEFEMMDESMNEFAIQLSLDLDKRFGIERKYRTVSQRDVPGPLYHVFIFYVSVFII